MVYCFLPQGTVSAKENSGSGSDEDLAFPTPDTARTLIDLRAAYLKYSVSIFLDCAEVH